MKIDRETAREVLRDLLPGMLFLFAIFLLGSVVQFFEHRSYEKLLIGVMISLSGLIIIFSFVWLVEYQARIKGYYSRLEADRARIAAAQESRPTSVLGRAFGVHGALGLIIAVLATSNLLIREYALDAAPAISKVLSVYAGIFHDLVAARVELILNRWWSVAFTPWQKDLLAIYLAGIPIGAYHAVTKPFPIYSEPSAKAGNAIIGGLAWPVIYFFTFLSVYTERPERAEEERGWPAHISRRMRRNMIIQLAAFCGGVLIFLLGNAALMQFRS